MHRREFLMAMAAAPIAVRGHVQDPMTRTFEIRTRIELPAARGRTRAWVPLPMSGAHAVPYQRWNGHTAAASGRLTPTEVSVDGAAMAIAEWDAPDDTPIFTVTYRVTTTNHRVRLDASRPMRPPPVDLDDYLRPTALIPTGGIVRETALAITKAHRTELARARAIYDWIVEHTVRDPDVKGCGLGDIRWMLETKNLSGKCADLNALFVGLSRAAGMPARDLYGLRVAPSPAFPSLGRSGGDVTTAQHCRAEVWVSNIGWVPVDPADIRKLMLEERRPSLDDPYVAQARRTLFGSWDMNWFAYNDAHDVKLPGSAGKPLPFLMYPQAEVNGARRDSLDPASFKYTISARQI
jgi:transglutaminase-like putative cysteine protease